MENMLPLQLPECSKSDCVAKNFLELFALGKVNSALAPQIYYHEQLNTMKKKSKY